MTYDASTSIMDGNDSRVLNEKLPVDPFRSLYVHFGMLLGVEDFRTVDAYHRGKMWFHSAWLHRQGTLWGLQVVLDKEAGEIRVKPGAALDPMGRELYLDVPACLNLSAWYEANKNDPDLKDIVEEDPGSGNKIFDAHVVIVAKGCLMRQVPALREPCDGSNATTAYSRVAETVDVILRPGSAPDWRAVGKLPFHRVRLLFGLEDAQTDIQGQPLPDDIAVLKKRQAILKMDAALQPAAYLEWLRNYSAMDEMEMRPGLKDDEKPTLLFPTEWAIAVPLADLNGLELSSSDNGWNIESGDVDNTIRPVHLPTSTIQELTCGPQMSSTITPPPDAPANPVLVPALAAGGDDAGGPRIDPKSVKLKGEKLSFKLKGPPLMKASVAPQAISVSAFDTADGWIEGVIKSIDYDASKHTITVDLRDAPGGVLVRLIVKGTGASPLLGRVGNKRIPLAGVVGGVPGGLYDGNDFVFMFKTRG